MKLENQWYKFLPLYIIGSFLVCMTGNNLLEQNWKYYFYPYYKKFHKVIIWYPNGSPTVSFLTGSSLTGISPTGQFNN